MVDEKYDQARDTAYRLRDIFGKGNFFLEIQDQGLPIEKRVNRDLVRLVEGNRDSAGGDERLPLSAP